MFVLTQKAKMLHLHVTCIVITKIGSIVAIKSCCSFLNEFDIKFAIMIKKNLALLKLMLNPRSRRWWWRKNDAWSSTKSAPEAHPGTEQDPCGLTIPGLETLLSRWRYMYLLLLFTNIFDSLDLFVTNSLIHLSLNYDVFDRFFII